MDAKVAHHGNMTSTHHESKSDASGKPKDTAIGWMKDDHKSDKQKQTETGSILSGLRTR
jgi:hypothetical protein